MKPAILAYISCILFIFFTLNGCGDDNNTNNNNSNLQNDSVPVLLFPSNDTVIHRNSQIRLGWSRPPAFTGGFNCYQVEINSLDTGGFGISIGNPTSEELLWECPSWDTITTHVTWNVHVICGHNWPYSEDRRITLTPYISNRDSIPILLTPPNDTSFQRGTPIHFKWTRPVAYNGGWQYILWISGNYSSSYPVYDEEIWLEPPPWDSSTTFEWIVRVGDSSSLWPWSQLRHFTVTP